MDLDGIDIDDSGRLTPETTRGQWAYGYIGTPLEQCVTLFVQTHGYRPAKARLVCGRWYLGPLREGRAA